MKPSGTRHVKPDRLPPPPLTGFLAEIEEASSRAIAIEIAMAFGGQAVSPPQAQRADRSVLQEKVSPEAVRVLAELRGVEGVDVPRGTAAVVHHLSVDLGLNNNQVARRAGCTARTVRRMLARWRASSGARPASS